MLLITLLIKENFLLRVDCGAHLSMGVEVVRRVDGKAISWIRVDKKSASSYACSH